MTLDDFMPFILSDVPGCPYPTAQMHLIQALTEFCRMTNAWNLVMPSTPLVDGQSAYTITPPAGGAVCTVMAAWVNGFRISERSLDALQNDLPTWMTMRSNIPTFYNITSNKSAVNVYPTPANANSAPLVLRVSFVPSGLATVSPITGAGTIPDVFGVAYMDAIASGTKERLMAIPAQSWTNPNLVSFHRERFMRGVFDAKADLLHEGVPGTISLRPRSFGF